MSMQHTCTLQRTRSKGVAAYTGLVYDQMHERQIATWLTCIYRAGGSS